MDKLVIVGTSGHAKVIIDIVQKQNTYKLIGFLDPFKEKGQKILGYEVLGSDEDLNPLLNKHGDFKLFIGVGDNWVRNTIYQKLIKISKQISFATLIHPSAQISSNVKIGDGVVIMAGVVVNIMTEIGDFSILNTNSSVDHDCRMGRFSSIAPNSVIGGNVTVGDFACVSIGTTINHNITIGKHTIIGAGSLLMKNCGECEIMYGIPATKIRSREIGEKYL
tara:strand:+ start:168 stop:830 length:663 start_codon:yes stop_codon:yes gene_type:complete